MSLHRIKSGTVTVYNIWATDSRTVSRFDLWIYITSQYECIPSFSVVWQTWGHEVHSHSFSERGNCCGERWTCFMFSTPKYFPVPLQLLRKQSKTTPLLRFIYLPVKDIKRLILCIPTPHDPVPRSFVQQLTTQLSCGPLKTKRSNWLEIDVNLFLLLFCSNAEATLGRPISFVYVF